MKILVLYLTKSWHPQRKAITDHLECYGKYLKDADVFYCNLAAGWPCYLNWIDYDGIILHTTLLDLNVRTLPWWPIVRDMLTPLTAMNGVKVALPQDEWDTTEKLCELFKLTGVESVFTCASPENHRRLYPLESSGVRYFQTTVPGFVDDIALAKVHQLTYEIPQRDIDIGYRARRMGFLCGRLGTLKHLLTEKFQEWQGKVSLKMDLSNKDKDVFYGDDWLRFLLRCRVMVGCVGGSSLLDFDGSIKQSVRKYLASKPEASFEEVEEHCFQDQEGQFCLSAISPRHFECAMTHTCQALVEGDYSGIEEFKPGEHYIEIKRDFSNLSDVLRQISDSEACQKIANRAYESLVESGRFTYQRFAKQVRDHIEGHSMRPAPAQLIRSAIVKFLLACRNANQYWLALRWRLRYWRFISLPKRLRSFGVGSNQRTR